MNTVIQPREGNSLIEMFNMQRELLDRYRILEDLPEFPIDLSKRSNQNLLRKYVQRLVEELSEAYDYLDKAYHHISQNYGEEAQELVEKFNEEIADVWHFVLEILLMVGIDEYGVKEWIKSAINTDRRLEGMLRPDDLLKGLLIYAEFLNREDNTMPKIIDRTVFIVYPPSDISDRPEIAGGSRLSHKQMGMSAEFCWEVTRRFNMSTNKLKARDWHQADSVKVNIIEFNQALFESFISLLRFMVYMGKGELSIYNSYVLKDRILWERFKTQ